MPIKSCLSSLAVCCLLISTLPTARAQLSVLSEGNPAKEWRKTQLALLEQQLADRTVVGELRQELAAQQKWLSAWQPGGLSAQPLWEPAEPVRQPAAEPVIDPQAQANRLRERLLGRGAQPTVKDTNALQQLLIENPEDIGLRQLHLHWLDQPQYRKTYGREIADAAIRLHALLDRLQPQDERIQLAKAYCLYRRVRAIAYRELPEVVRAKPIEDPQKFEADLLGAYNQLIAAAGRGRPEFILIDIRMLRRDGFYGRALEMLTDHSAVIEKQWFLKKRRDLLRELGWDAPASEAAALYAAAFPEAVAAEEDH